MSIFSELITQLNAISIAYTNNLKKSLEAALATLDKVAEDHQNSRGKLKEHAQRNRIASTNLQSIHEDEVENTNLPNSRKGQTSDSSKKSSKSTENDDNTNEKVSSEICEKPKRLSKKRTKNEVDGISSPEQDKRPKRNASARAQAVISKQVNVNLTQKLRRDESTDTLRSTHNCRHNKEENKENKKPEIPVVHIKQEKISLPPESMEVETLPPETIAYAAVKQEVDKDEAAMPPPAAPLPKPRKALQKEKSEESSDDASSRQRSRNKKTTDIIPPPVSEATSRATRASARSSSRASARAINQLEQEPPVEERPKRTRNRKKATEAVNNAEKDDAQPSVESSLESPAEKPRPKRTRRERAAKKQEEKEEVKTKEAEADTIALIEVLPSESEILSPILPQRELKKKSQVINTNSQESNGKKPDKIPVAKTKEVVNDNNGERKESLDKEESTEVDGALKNVNLEETRIIDTAVMNATVVLEKLTIPPNEVHSHKTIAIMNETVVLESINRETMVLDKPQNRIMDATVIIDKDPKQANITEDEPLLTDDSSFAQQCHTPPTCEQTAMPQPTSAVKEKVQQFEELASRVTRTKTRAMAKKDQETEPEQNEQKKETPPDKTVKTGLSAETLAKMNNMIFNGKPPQVSSSATKLMPNVVTNIKSFLPSSTSKLASVSKHKEAAEESLMKNDKEDARKKKEALLEARREQQKRKREEKMAAAAAAREAAERERRAALQAAERGRLEKQAHAHHGRQERLREVERKKLELARKTAETEERRKAEEQARLARLADEQRRAEAARRKHAEETEAMKREAAIMAKEIEKRQKEYMEKQKIKRVESGMYSTPLKYPIMVGGSSPEAVEPAYMADGFEFLNSDEEAEPVSRPVPAWCASKAFGAQLRAQAALDPVLTDRLFGVRPRTVDLRAVFPALDRRQLKRTSSAVWRTPPGQEQHRC